MGPLIFEEWKKNIFIFLEYFFHSKWRFLLVNGGEGWEISFI